MSSRHNHPTPDGRTARLADTALDSPAARVPQHGQGAHATPLLATVGAGESHGLSEAARQQSHGRNDAAAQVRPAVASRDFRATPQGRACLNSNRQEAAPVATAVFRAATKHLKQDVIAATWGTTRQNVAKYLDGELPVSLRDLLALKDTKALESLQDQLGAIVAVMRADEAKKQAAVSRSIDQEFFALSAKVGCLAAKMEESRSPNSPAGKGWSQQEKEEAIRRAEELREAAERLVQAARELPVEH